MKHNFGPGPGILPHEVLKQAAAVDRGLAEFDLSYWKFLTAHPSLKAF